MNKRITVKLNGASCIGLALVLASPNMPMTWSAFGLGLMLIAINIRFEKAEQESKQ